MEHAEAVKVVKEHRGERVLVKTSYGSDLEGTLVKATPRALVIDTEEPGQRGVFLKQVVAVKPVEECDGCDKEHPCAECADADAAAPAFYAILTARSAVELRDYSDATRERLAKSGKALDDGSFPIRNRKDLQNAVKSVGRASDAGKARAHIVKRANELNATDLLPPSWKESTGGGDQAHRLARMERAVSALATRVLAG